MVNINLEAYGQNVLHVEFNPVVDNVDGLFYPAIEERSNDIFVRKLRYIIGFEDEPTAQVFANTIAHEERDRYESIMRNFING